MAEEPLVVSEETSMKEYINARREGVEVTEVPEGKTATKEEPGEEKHEEKDEKTEAKEESEEVEEAGAKEEGLPAWVKKRIARAKTQRDKATSRSQELEAELDELRARGAEKQTAEPVKSYAEGEPKPEDFETTEAYIKAQARWEVRQELAEQEATKTKAAQEAKDRETLDGYAKRVSEAKEKHDDWDEVYESVGDMTIPSSVQLALIKRKDGPELVYHLAKNPELVKLLNEMDPLEAVSELGGIAKSISSSRSEESAPVRKSVSSAPAPIKPVGGAGTKSQRRLDDDDVSMKEYIEARRAGRTV